MHIELDQIRFERIHTECAFAQSGSVNPNPLPEVVSIRIDLDRAITRCAVRTKKGMACTLVSNTDSERVSPGYTLCFMYLLNSRSNMMAG